MSDGVGYLRKQNREVPATEGVIKTTNTLRTETMQMKGSLGQLKAMRFDFLHNYVTGTREHSFEMINS